MNNKVSVYRIIMIICGALAILGFFFIPCYYNSLWSSAGTIGNLLGVESVDTELVNISAFQFVRVVIEGAAELEELGLEGEINTVGSIILFGLPELVALILVVFSIIGKKAGAIGGIVCSSIMMLCYFIQVFTVPSILKAVGYGISFFYYLFILLTILSLIMAIMELRNCAVPAYGGKNSWDGYDNRGYDDTIYDGGYESSNNDYSQIRRKEGVIVGVKGEYKGATLPAADGVRIAIGRNAKECNLVLTNPAVSRIHCYVTYYADRDVYGVTDVSKFGVYDIQGKLIEKDQVVYMGTGDEIQIGKSNNVFRLE